MKLLFLLLIVFLHSTNAFPEPLPRVTDNNPTNTSRVSDTTSSNAASQEVDREKYPWFVRIHGYLASFTSRFCSGSLVSERHVLTAAHCVSTEIIVKELTNPSPEEFMTALNAGRDVMLAPITSLINVTVGGNQHCDDSLRSRGRNYGLSEVRIHEKYQILSSGLFLNDIALLTLSENVVGMKPISLPRSGWKTSNQSAGPVGFRRSETTDKPCHLDEAKLEIFTKEECNARIRELGLNLGDSSGLICAGMELNGTRFSDEGGPLVVAEDDRLALEGIASTYLNGLLIFVDVKEYIPWIEESLEVNSTLSKPTTPKINETEHS